MPDILDAEPLDPFAAGLSLRYAREDAEGDFVVYSVGADGTDEGGIDERGIWVRVARDGAAGGGQ